MYVIWVMAKLLQNYLKFSLKALQKAIENKGITESGVNAVLEKYSYKKLEDILVVDYAKVCNEFSKYGVAQLINY